MKRIIPVFVILLLSFVQQVYAYDSYVYFQNFDETNWRIHQYNGAPPNQDYVTPEGVRVLCWILHRSSRGIDVKLENIQNPEIILADVTFYRGTDILDIFIPHLYIHNEYYPANTLNVKYFQNFDNIWVTGGDYPLVRSNYDCIPP